jgi:hypothetical protein
MPNLQYISIGAGHRGAGSGYFGLGPRNPFCFQKYVIPVKAEKILDILIADRVFSRGALACSKTSAVAADSTATTARNAGHFFTVYAALSASGSRKSRRGRRPETFMCDPSRQPPKISSAVAERHGAHGV